MNRQILIIHGWMHSADRYKRLKRDLEATGDCEVTLYELPGFGNTPAEKYHHLLEFYARKVRKKLTEGNYDYAVGHSMGGTVLLRAMDGRKLRTKLVLLSPVYEGVALLKPFTPLIPFLPFLFWVLKIPCIPTTFFIKSIALFTVNRWNRIDRQIETDTRRASPLAASCTMFELAWDRWKIRDWKCGKVIVILGEKDRLIERRKMKRLRKDLGNCSIFIIEGIGHTAVVEAYDRLFQVLARIFILHI